MKILYYYEIFWISRTYKENFNYWHVSSTCQETILCESMFFCFCSTVNAQPWKAEMMSPSEAEGRFTWNQHKKENIFIMGQRLGRFTSSLLRRLDSLKLEVFQQWHKCTVCVISTSSPPHHPKSNWSACKPRNVTAS